MANKRYACGQVYCKTGAHYISRNTGTRISISKNGNKITLCSECGKQIRSLPRERIFKEKLRK